jgi:hypothetical protein
MACGRRAQRARYGDHLDAGGRHARDGFLDAIHRRSASLAESASVQHMCPASTAHNVNGVYSPSHELCCTLHFLVEQMKPSADSM